MQQNELIELAKYLDEITAATINGKMIWQKANPSTYVYGPVNGPGKIIIQVGTSSGILFQVRGPLEGDVKLEAYSSQHSILNQKLNALFLIIEKLRDVKALDFLKGIIPH
jgi:hypothetical protein